MPKKVNYYQNKKINEQLKKNRQDIDIDAAELKIREMLVLNGFNMSEIAAILFTVMRNILLYEKNGDVLKGIGIDPTQLNTEAVTEIQKLLIKEYLNGLNDANPTTQA
jgi:hypothetical protein